LVNGFFVIATSCAPPFCLVKSRCAAEIKQVDREGGCCVWVHVKQESCSPRYQVFAKNMRDRGEEKCVGTLDSYGGALAAAKRVVEFSLRNHKGLESCKSYGKQASIRPVAKAPIRLFPLWIMPGNWHRNLLEDKNIPRGPACKQIFL
jgi:hypothetical protein